MADVMVGLDAVGGELHRGAQAVAGHLAHGLRFSSLLARWHMIPEEPRAGPEVEEGDPMLFRQVFTPVLVAVACIVAAEAGARDSTALVPGTLPAACDRACL